MRAFPVASQPRAWSKLKIVLTACYDSSLSVTASFSASDGQTHVPRLPAMTHVSVSRPFRLLRHRPTRCGVRYDCEEPAFLPWARCSETHHGG